MKQFTYVITDPVGIHARPAGLLVREAKEYKSEILMAKDGKSAPATKLTALMGLGVRCGDTVTITVTGRDEAAASAGIEQLLKDNL